MLANAFAQLLGSRLIPPEAEFRDPRMTLPSGMMDAAMLFEQELTTRNHRSMMPNLYGLWG